MFTAESRQTKERVTAGLQDKLQSFVWSLFPAAAAQTRWWVRTWEAVVVGVIQMLTTHIVDKGALSQYEPDKPW